MKTNILFLFIQFLSILSLKGQDTLFFDDFENGLSNWQTTGQWGITTLQSHSPTHSLSESPNGNYGNNWNTYCTMANGVNLIHIPGAKVVFWITYKIETGFDYLYVEVSKDNFQTYTTIATFNGELNSLPPFEQKIIDIGAYCGYSNVKIRFHFYSDQGYVTDGAYIDDFLIITDANDNSAPLIVHNPLPFMEGSLNDHTILADIYDYSGINLSALKLYYSVDNGIEHQISGQYQGGNTYSFIIPAQLPGSLVRYYIYAEDNWYIPNVSYSDTFEYIAGHHIIQDNGQVDYFMRLSAGQGAAVKVVLSNTRLVSLLIRNYVDINNPNDSMLVHVWDDNNGAPGNDVIPPRMVYPAATLNNTSPMTWVDLRNDSLLLSNLNGTYYIGFTVPTGYVNITITQPGNFGRSYFFDGASWSTSIGSSGINDHHFRAVTAESDDVEGPIIVNNTIPLHYEASPLDQTINATISDISGVASAFLYYSVDNGPTQIVAGNNYSGNYWNFTIPSQPAGAWVKYWIEATDMASPSPFTSYTDTFTYVSGVYYKYDHNTPNVYIPVGSLYNTLQGIAERIDLGTNPVQLTTILIRNYYSVSNPSNTPNDPMRIHVWTNDNGLPGVDLISSFIVNSEANVSNPMAMTRVDLRPYAAQLSNLSGSVFVGYTVDNGMCAVLGDTNQLYNNTFAYDGVAWAPYYTDAQIRAVSSQYTSNVTALLNDNYIDVYPNPVNDWVNVYIENFKNSYVEIYSMQGQLILQLPVNNYNTLINLNQLNKGVYLLKVNNLEQSRTFKLIKY